MKKSSRERRKQARKFVREYKHIVQGLYQDYVSPFELTFREPDTDPCNSSSNQVFLYEQWATGPVNSLSIE